MRQVHRSQRPASAVRRGRTTGATGPARRQQARRARPAGGESPDLREAILSATASLLADKQFGELAVSDILRTAGVSRGSFYFYFDSKQDVLAELVRRAVAQGHAAASPWLARPVDKIAALRAGTAAGAALWQANAPVLRAIVENWRTDPRLTDLWCQQMQTFADAALDQVSGDDDVIERLGGVDIAAVVSSLTWLSERLYYLAAVRTPPFDNQDTLVETLVRIWAATLYGI
jgi:TetR/AcrR family transcriptional regulator, ethionamide resistance regulator